MEKLFLVCDVFYRVAKLFVDAVKKDPQISVQLRNELDPFMTKIGSYSDMYVNSQMNGFASEDVLPHTGSWDTTHVTEVSASDTWFAENNLVATLLGENFDFLGPALQAETE